MKGAQGCSQLVKAVMLRCYVGLEAVKAPKMVRQTMMRESLQTVVRPAASVCTEGALKAAICRGGGGGGGGGGDKHLGPVLKPSQWTSTGVVNRSSRLAMA